MQDTPPVSLVEHFAELEDFRVDRTKRHELLDIMVIAICAVVGGADSWTDVELFGKSKMEWFDRVLGLPNGIPSHDTFGRVFARLDAERFEECFMNWVRAVSGVLGGPVVAIDGKTIRRSHDKFIGKSAIHMVSAWAEGSNLILGQTKVDDRSNEITAIPELLQMLDVSGCIVTIDAMGCQKGIAAKVVDKGADYVLAVKKNQPELHEAVKDTFDQARRDGFANVAHRFSETIDKGHGRIETRRCWAVSDPDYINYVDERRQWLNLTSLAMVESERLVKGRTSVETRYFISSLPNDAQALLDAVRGHWGIENSVHWVLDVTFGEDQCTVRKGNAAQNLSVIRRFALNMLKRETTSKGGIAAKRKRAGWDTDYLQDVLSQN